MAQRNNEIAKEWKIVRNKKEIRIIVWRIKKRRSCKLVRKRKLFLIGEGKSGLSTVRII